MRTAGLEHQGALDVLGRVARLERAARRWRVLSAVSVLMLVWGGWFLSSSSASADDDENGMYQVRGLVLVDAKGKPRASWTVTDDGSVILTMDDARENTRLAMVVDKAGNAEVGFLNPNGNPQASWTAVDGATELAFFNNAGRIRFSARVGENAAALLLNDAKGRTRALWSVMSAAGLSKAELGFYDADSKRRLVLGSTTDGTSAIWFPDTSNPMDVVGGWWVHESTLSTMSKGSLPSSLRGR